MSVEFAFDAPNEFIGPTFGKSGLSAVSESDESDAHTFGARKRWVGKLPLLDERIVEAAP